MKIWLIRHGMTEANERRLYCGSTDLPLSDHGREELKSVRYTVAMARGSSPAECAAATRR